MQIFDGNYDEIHDWIVRGQGVAEAAACYPGRFIPLVYLNPLEGADICREKVETVMIHMGHGHGVYIDAALKMAKRFPNIYLEMSGIPMDVKIRQAYEEVGHDRIMFGTDYPFHHPSVEIQKVPTCGLD